MAGKLGFGFMRLPLLSEAQEDIDFDQLTQMVDEFLEAGFSYFDTSFAYHGGTSEAALRRVLVKRHPRERYQVATKFPTFAVQGEGEVEGIFAKQLENLGLECVDRYLLHILNTKFYNGVDGRGGVVKTCRLFEHAAQWKRQGKIGRLGFSFHDSPEVLDQILSEHPEVEFVQIILNYFDWRSYLIDAKGCYDVIRKHGREVVVMEPVKGGVLAQVPAASEAWMRGQDPDISPSGWALRFAASQPGVTTVLSGMSTLGQVRDNVKAMSGFKTLTAEEQSKLVELAQLQKAAGPEGTGDFSRFEGAAYHGVSVAAILDTYNSALVQPNPLFSAEMNYLANLVLATQGIADLKGHAFPKERVVLDGDDITVRVGEAWSYLVEHSFVM